MIDAIIKKPKTISNRVSWHSVSMKVVSNKNMRSDTQALPKRRQENNHKRLRSPQTVIL